MSNVSFAAEASQLESRWAKDPRWNGVERTYTAEDVVRLRGSVQVEHSPAWRGRRVVGAAHRKEYVHTFGALTGAQAVQMVKAGLQAIYLSGWQVAADGNLAGQTYPDQSIYPRTACPRWCAGSTTRCMRADQIEWSEGKHEREWLAPIVADAEAGFGGPIHAFELMKAMIEAGAARRALRRPAGGGKEVRPHGRQGARSHRAVRPHAQRGAAGHRRARRSDGDRRAHRRARGHADDERHR